MPLVNIHQDGSYGIGYSWWNLQDWYSSCLELLSQNLVPSQELQLALYHLDILRMASSWKLRTRNAPPFGSKKFLVVACSHSLSIKFSSSCSSYSWSSQRRHHCLVHHLGCLVHHLGYPHHHMRPWPMVYPCARRLCNKMQILNNVCVHLNPPSIPR